MKRASLRTPLLLVSVLAAGALHVRGAGFGLYDGSARGNVTPASLAAKGGDPSAQYFNGAAITSLEGTRLQAGLTAIAPWADVTTRSPYTGAYARSYGDGKIWPIPHLYLASQLTGSLWFGLGFATRYGLGAEFPGDWPGRYSNYKAEILSFDAAPLLAWKVNDRLSLSLGLSLRYFDIELAQKIDAAGAAGLRPYNDPSPSPFDVDQNLHGDDVRPAVDLGLVYRPVESVSLGAAYHSRIHFHVEGDAKWRAPAAVQAQAPLFFHDCGFRSKNYNPDWFVLSVAWDATDRLTLSAGAIYTTWHLYKDLVISLDEPAVFGRDTLVSAKRWNDTWRASVGADYRLSDEWTLRAGYTWDQSPINSTTVDYLVPGDNRHILAVGAGWARGAWAVEGSYFYEFVDDFDVRGRPANGVFDGSFTGAKGHALALSVSRTL